VEATSIELGQATYPHSEYRLTVYQDEIQYDPTSIFFRRGYPFPWQALTFTTTNIDEGSDWYLADYGDEFSTRTIEAGEFGPLWGTWQHETITVSGEFYLGVNTGKGYYEDEDGYFHELRDVFGWVKLRNTPEGIEQLDCAVAYGNGGIIIGTSTVVPEPSQFGLVAGLIALAAAWRSSRGARRA
jgi:hypothetical protein